MALAFTGPTCQRASRKPRRIQVGFAKTAEARCLLKPLFLFLKAFFREAAFSRRASGKRPAEVAFPPLVLILPPILSKKLQTTIFPLKAIENRGPMGESGNPGWFKKGSSGDLAPKTSSKTYLGGHLGVVLGAKLT